MRRHRLAHLPGLVFLTVITFASAGYAQSVMVSRRGVYQGDWITRTEDYDNCDNSQPIYYDLQEKIKLSQTLTIKSGWTLKPGLAVTVPGIGQVSLGAELQRDYQTSQTVDRDSRQSLRTQVPQGSHMRYTISFRETFLTGTIEVVQKSYLGLKTKREHSDFSLLTRREIKLTPENLGCFSGKWGFYAWEEQTGKRGVGDILNLPQRKHIRGGWLKIDQAGTVEWHLDVTPLSLRGHAVELQCLGRLDKTSTRIHPSKVSWAVGTMPQVDSKERGEFGYALCGRGGSQRYGRTFEQDFRVDLIVERQAKVLQMTNSEGTFRWVWIGR